MLLLNGLCMRRVRDAAPYDQRGCKAETLPHSPGASPHREAVERSETDEVVLRCSTNVCGGLKTTSSGASRHLPREGKAFWEMALRATFPVRGRRCGVDASRQPPREGRPWQGPHVTARPGGRTCVSARRFCMHPAGPYAPAISFCTYLGSLSSTRRWESAHSSRRRSSEQPASSNTETQVFLSA